MGQFKPMVKMMTTEPTVELKLKKGGHAKMPKMKSGGDASGHKPMGKMDGGVMGALSSTPALVGRPALNAPVKAPGKPSMAARRKAMMPMAKPTGMMKKGGEVESLKEHKAEMKKMSKIETELKSHEGKPASKAHKGLKTGGVVLGNGGGFKKGGLAKSGIINTEDQGGAYRNTKMHSAEYTGKTSGKTGDVKMGNGGGYKTGGVALSNSGGYKKGGKASKKAYATGGAVNDAGRAVAMPQGSKRKPSSVAISQLSGTYKSGGKVTPAEGRLQKAFDSENATAMRQAKSYSVDPTRKVKPASLELRKGGKAKKYNGGGGAKSDMDMSNGAYDRHYANERAENEADSKAVKDALMFIPRKIKGAYDALKGQGAVTTTEREISKTVTPPAKKRGGRAC